MGEFVINGYIMCKREIIFFINNSFSITYSLSETVSEKNLKKINKYLQETFSNEGETKYADSSNSSKALLTVMANLLNYL